MTAKNSFWIEKEKGSLEDTLRPASKTLGLEGFNQFATENGLNALIPEAATLAEKYPAGTGDDAANGDSPKIVLEPYRYPTY